MSIGGRSVRLPSLSGLPRGTSTTSSGEGGRPLSNGRRRDGSTGKEKVLASRAQESVDRLVNLAQSTDATAYIEGLVEAAREHLGLDIAYVSEFVDGRQVFQVVEGDGSTFGIEEGGSVALPETYCMRMLDGQIPNLIVDAGNDERVNQLPTTGDCGIGAYVGVPIRFSDGRLFGTFCSLGRDAAPELSDRDLNFVRVLARLVGSFLEAQIVAQENARLEIETAGMEALAAALEARDGYTGEHSAAVVDLCEAVAEVLGIEEPSLTMVRQVGLLHDIGKVGIPDSILRKSGPLSDEEWVVMKTHPEIGRTIVESTSSLAHLGPAIGAEHEHWDGGGYPRGLKGEEIPLESRIVLACDAWHAMTSARPYRRALSSVEATGRLIQGRGSQFDPNVVDALDFLLRKGPTDVALRRYRHDKNNLAQLIEFERYLDGDPADELRTAITEKEASLRLRESE